MSGEYVQQLNLFGSINPHFKLKGKVKVIELFAGIGSQIKALKVLEKAQGENKEFTIEHHKICEWAYNSYVMYNLIHTKDFTDYSMGKTKEEMLERIKGTSTDYNTPLTMDQLKKKPIEWVRKAYNSCIATHNLVDISNVKGRDLDFDDNVNETVIMSYSFPCQDISLSGNQASLEKGSGTRSGLLWEVERLLEEREREIAIAECLTHGKCRKLALTKTFIASKILGRKIVQFRLYQPYQSVRHRKKWWNTTTPRKSVYDFNTWRLCL